MNFVLRLRGESLELPLHGESIDFIYRDTLPDLEEHADLGEISDPSPCFRRVGVVVSAIMELCFLFILILEDWVFALSL